MKKKKIRFTFITNYLDETTTTRPMRPKVFVLEDRKSDRSQASRNRVSSTTYPTTTSVIAATTSTSTTTTATTITTPIAAEIESTSEKARYNQRANQNKRVGQARRFKQQTTTAEPFYEDYQGKKSEKKKKKIFQIKRF